MIFECQVCHSLFKGKKRKGQPRKFCSIACRSKAWTGSGNPNYGNHVLRGRKCGTFTEEHKKKISQAIKKYFQENPSKKFEATKKANQVVRQLVKENKWILQDPNFHKKYNYKVLGLPSPMLNKKRPKHSELMKVKNPMFNPYVVAKVWRIRNGTSIEQKIKEELERRRIPFIWQYPFYVGSQPAVADFKIGNIIVECDGHYWHSSKPTRIWDRIRDTYLSSRGYKVLRFNEDEINKSPAECVDKIVECLKPT